MPSSRPKAFNVHRAEGKVGSRLRVVRFSASTGTGERNGFLFHLSRSQVRARAAARHNEALRLRRIVSVLAGDHGRMSVVILNRGMLLYQLDKFCVSVIS